MSRSLGRVPGRVRHGWRRSLTLRVVTTTLVLSAVVAALIGFTILQQVRAGLLDGATRTASEQLSTGLERAQSQFEALPRTDSTTVERTAYAVVSDLAGPAGQQDYDVVMLASTPGLRSYAPDVEPASIPAALRSAVTQQQREAWSYTEIISDDGQREPGIASGAPVVAGGNRYELYYLFPLTREAQAIALVERTMVFAGLALVLLLASIAAVVTRQVVRPVRLAAASAQRLAAGQLEDRLSVRGEDDLATLAVSFNGMADTVSRQISQLRELSRVQHRFVSDVSHELRTPTTTVRMAADLLYSSRAEMSPELVRTTELMHDQLARFEQLLADLLEISRYDAGVVVLEAEALDLGALARQVVERNAVLAASRGSVVEVDLPEQPLVIEADHRRIDRALRNLVENAVEHAEGTPVVVTVRGGATCVAITVVDHGIGLRPGEAALVFGRFWRADPARARTTGGTGLGLSIALEDVRLHGGWLQAAGEPGQGAVFRMTLPRRTGDEVADPPLPLSLSPLAELDPGSRPATEAPSTRSAAADAAEPASSRAAGGTRG